jgi:four helix bundle protein
VNKIELQQRTKRFALRVIKMVSVLPKNLEGRTIGSQLIRAATSVGANYRASCKARSRAEFIAKLGIVEEESDECCYWIELVIEAELIEAELVKPLLREANEITAIFGASRRTAGSNRKIQDSRATRVQLNRQSEIGNRK